MLEVMGPSRSGPQDDSGQHHRTAVNHAPDDTPDDSIDKVLGQQFHPAHRLADGSAHRVVVKVAHLLVCATR